MLEHLQGDVQAEIDRRRRDEGTRGERRAAADVQDDLAAGFGHEAFQLPGVGAPAAAQPLHEPHDGIVIGGREGIEALLDDLLLLGDGEGGQEIDDALLLREDPSAARTGERLPIARQALAAARAEG